jgi:hypothetical protein
VLLQDDDPLHRASDQPVDRHEVLEHGGQLGHLRQHGEPEGRAALAVSVRAALAGSVRAALAGSIRAASSGE